MSTGSPMPKSSICHPLLSGSVTWSCTGVAVVSSIQRSTGYTASGLTVLMKGYSLRAAHFAFEVKRVAILHPLLADHLGLLDARPHDVGNAGLGKQQNAVERGVGRGLAELLRQGVALKRALRHPDARQLQDGAVLERDLDVAGHSVRRCIDTLRERERDRVLLVENGRRALASHGEPGALERKDGAGRPIQLILNRARARSWLRLLETRHMDGGDEHREQQQDGDCGALQQNLQIAEALCVRGQTRSFACVAERHGVSTLERRTPNDTITISRASPTRSCRPSSCWPCPQDPAGRDRR